MDQLQHWNNLHAHQRLRDYSHTHTSFAEEVTTTLIEPIELLELGCGEGNDSIFFAQQGHQVVATDFSDVIIEQNQNDSDNSNVKFDILDMMKPFAFADDRFDVIYARLSLHYFSDVITRRLLREISRVLKPDGNAYFMCKSTADSLYGKGARIEADIYENDGHVRHFFSQKYAQAICSDAGLSIAKVVTGNELIYGRRSAFIKVVAHKPTNNTK